MLANQSTFQSHLATLQGDNDYIIARKKNEWEKFLELPMPGRKDEFWRFSSHRNFDLAQYALAEKPSPATAEKAIAASDLTKDSAGCLVFVDGYLVHSYLDPKLAGKGVVWEPISSAFIKYPDLIAEYFLQEKAKLGSEKFVALNGALTSSGCLLRVPENIAIDKPFVTYHWSAAKNSASFPHTLVVAEKNSSASVLDFYQSLDATAPALVCAVGDIHACQGAKVFRKNVQNLNDKSLSFIIDASIAQEAADIKTLSVHLGCYRARSEQLVHIKGSEANVKMYALTVADEKQEFDQRTLQIHSAPHANSDLLYKNALMDDATTIFSGLIRVDVGAQQTDAYQKNRNLILSPGAQAHSLPGLEIEANDVKCSHGATSASLEPEELFYLLARGIPRKSAYELLVMGFFEEIIEKLDNEALIEKLRHILQEKFHSRTE